MPIGPYCPEACAVPAYIYIYIYMLFCHALRMPPALLGVGCFGVSWARLGIGCRCAAWRYILCIIPVRRFGRCCHAPVARAPNPSVFYRANVPRYMGAFACEHSHLTVGSHQIYIYIYIYIYTYIYMESISFLAQGSINSWRPPASLCRFRESCFPWGAAARDVSSA